MLPKQSRGGFKGKRKEGDKDDSLVRTSKSLAYLLRHGAEKEGLSIREDGYVLLDEILERPDFASKKITEEFVRKVVEENDKKRFELKDIKNEVTGKIELYIRAAQGHTIKTVDDDQLLKKIEDCTLFPIVVHGTYLKFWEAIKKEGLKKMSRNHVHFAPGLPGEKDVISGMRGSCEILIEIDLKQAISDGMEFYVSSNNVILTKGFDGVVNPKYFSKVVNRKTGVSLL